MQKFLFILFLSVLVFSSCKETNYYPKPLGFSRIAFPDKVTMKTYDGNCPYTYQYPDFAIVNDLEKCNQNIAFPSYNATLHITNVQFDNSKSNNLFIHSEKSRKYAYEHRIKADAINEKAYSNDSLGVYGVTYEIIGNVASNYQFYLTDSNSNFYRGALYFNQKPNIDSLRPVLDFLKTNINTMIETFDWK